jgi:hypothetical protein
VVLFPIRARIFLFATAVSRTAVGPTQLPISGYRDFFRGGEADHSPPPRDEVKNVWRCTSTPPLIKTVWRARVKFPALSTLSLEGRSWPPAGHAISEWLTAWSWVLLETLTVAQLAQNSYFFHGARRFITVFTRTRHWSLSWARWIQSTTSFHPTSTKGNHSNMADVRVFKKGQS